MMDSWQQEAVKRKERVSSFKLSSCHWRSECTFAYWLKWAAIGAWQGIPKKS